MKLFGYLLLVLTSGFIVSQDLVFTVTTPNTDSSNGLTTTFIDNTQAASALIGGPAMAYGTIPSSIVTQICSTIVNTGQFSFTTSFQAYGVTLTPTLNLQATGGCGNPSSPGLVQVRVQLTIFD